MTWFAAAAEVFQHRAQLVETAVTGRGLIKAGEDGNADEFRLVQMRHNDFTEVERIRGKYRDWLSQWEATMPPENQDAQMTMARYLRECRRQMSAGAMVPMKMVLDGRTVGQMTLSGIIRGALQSGSLGYWVAEDVAGRGITTLAVAMMIDFCFTDLRLHRIEISIRPENERSLRVVQKLELRSEGLRPRYIHIAGQWADHQVFAITTEEVPAGGMVRFWEQKNSH